MKTKVFLLCIAMLSGLAANHSCCAQTGSELTGTWRCQAPSAPAGYTSSIMEITCDSVTVTFTGDDNPYAATILKFDSDSLIFIINGLDAKCVFRAEDSKSMSGKAVWPEGESPLILTRIEDL